MLGEKLQEQGVFYSAVDDDGGADVVVDGADACFYFGDHAANDRAVFD